jgi:hypothetical protein
MNHDDELAEADRRVAEAEDYILRQEQLIARNTADGVSTSAADLESIGAISPRRERVAGMRGPGMVRYFMNPNVGTHLLGHVREEAQAQASPLKLDPKPKPRKPKLVPVE